MRATEMCATNRIDKTPQSLAGHMWCFFYLLKTITKVIIKATATIVTAISPKNNSHAN